MKPEAPVTSGQACPITATDDTFCQDNQVWECYDFLTDDGNGNIVRKQEWRVKRDCGNDVCDDRRRSCPPCSRGSWRDLTYRASGDAS